MIEDRRPESLPLGARASRPHKAWHSRCYFDRYVRDSKHLAAVTEYIERNPVKSGL